MEDHRRPWGVVTFAQALGLAAAYFVVSKLGLLLAIPPGFATAVWPASGIALGCLLIYGVHLWPGVLLGSMLVNLSVTYDSSGAAALAISLLVPFSIGIGAAMQAVLGTVLIRRYVGFPTNLDDDGEVIKFLLLGGPLACLLNATWGSTTLFISGVISPESYGFIWGTWWVGDAIGVLIFTPLALIALATPRDVWRPRAHTVGIPLAVAFAVAVTIFYTTASQSWEVLTGALLFTGLLGAFLLELSGRTTKIERIIGQRTTELRLSEERFRDFANATSDWFWDMDENLRFTHFSYRFTEISGVADKDLIGKTRQESGLDLKDEQVRKNIGDLKAYRPFKNFEHSRTRPDGSVVHMSSSGTPVFDKDGTFLGYRGTGTDITERKQAEERLTTAIESMPEGFLYFDADDRLAVVNSKMATTYPLQADLFVPGISYEKILRSGVDRGQFGPGDGQDAEEWIQERLAYHRDPKGFFEYSLPDGRTIRVEEKKTPDGGTVGVRTDITDLKQAEENLRESEERLRLSLSSGRIGTFSWNIQEGSHYWDDRMHEIWGLASGTYQGVMEADFLGSLHPEDSERVSEAVSRTLDDDAEYDLEYRIIQPDESICHVHAVASLLRDDQGHPLQLMGVCEDISERKQIEEKKMGGQPGTGTPRRRTDEGAAGKRVETPRRLRPHARLPELEGYRRPVPPGQQAL